jgi:glycosyltransferase involved in cell wall biosynthesis
MKVDDVALYHRDVPFVFPHWNAVSNQCGFDPKKRAALQDLRQPDPGIDRVDAVYRVCSPFRTGSGDALSDRPTLTFMITELGLSSGDFHQDGHPSSVLAQDGNRIVTSTRWSRDRIVEYGFPTEHVDIAPLGVDERVFTRIWPSQRRHAREVLRVDENEILFLNIGAPLWTKGTDLLLQAFAVLRQRGLPVRLLMKDQSDLYGISPVQMLEKIGSQWPSSMRQSVLDAIMTVPHNLTPQQLHMLFGAADCYVSPYRAEGFNLPVLEAIACGLPTIVTQGGATDDFCDDILSLRVPGRFGRRDEAGGLRAAFIEPDFDALVEAMDRFARGWRPDHADFDVARRQVLERFNWRRSAEETLRIVRDGLSGVNSRLIG